MLRMSGGSGKAPADEMADAPADDLHLATIAFVTEMTTELVEEKDKANAELQNANAEVQKANADAIGGRRCRGLHRVSLCGPSAMQLNILACAGGPMALRARELRRSSFGRTLRVHAGNRDL